MSQSESGFLELVVNWDVSQCRDNLDTALPRLIECFQEINAVQEQVGILKIICHSFLPCVPVSDAEEKVFSRLIDEVCGLFDLTLDDIHLKSQNTDRKSSLPHITSGLQVLLDLLEFLETCVCHMQTGTTPLGWNLVHSLPRGALHILKGAYGHCKISGELYQELLSSLSVPLSNLFKKTHSLQVAFLRLLDCLRVSDPITEQDVQDVTQVCRGLFEVCQIVTSLDMKLVVTLWKAISKHAVSHKAHIGQRLGVGDMVSHLSGEIQTGFTYLLQLIPNVDPEGVVMSQGDEKGFQKSLKILGFQMKILVMLVRDFREFVDRCEDQVYTLIVMFHRLLPPSLSSQPMDQKYVLDIQQHLTNATDVLIKVLLPNKAFIEIVTGSNRVGALEGDRSLGHLQILLKVLDILPQMQDAVQQLWIDPFLYPEDTESLGIIDAVFRTTAKCHVEMSLPVVMNDPSLTGNTDREMTLYENCCTKLCGFLGCLTAKVFHKAEEALMMNVLSHDLWCCLLAEDVWCFLVRYGSADLCRDHVNLLVELMKQSPMFPLQSPLLSVVVRLIKSLAPEDQSELIQRLGACQDFVSLTVLACAVPSFTEANCQSVVQCVTEKCSRVLQDYTSAESMSGGDLYTLSQCLSCLWLLWSQNDTIQLALPSHVTSAITNSVSLLWRGMDPSGWGTAQLPALCLGNLILLTSHLLTSLEMDVLEKILSVIGSCLEQDSSQQLELIIVFFLRSFGNVRLPASPKQPQMLKRLSDLFVTALTSSDLFIHHHGLAAFTKFAEETMHESVVPDCINSQPQLQDFVVQFINKMPFMGSEGWNRLELLRWEPPTDPEVRSDLDCFMDPQVEPSNKRPRLMDDTDQHKMSPKLKKCVKELVLALRKTLPDLETFTNSEATDLNPETWNQLDQIQTKLTAVTKEKG
ncbi:FIGNL1-interacting regulator of recombination and mitosis-like isoform X2 [Crassostrea virginica]